MGLSIQGLKANTSRLRKLIWNKFHFVHLPIRCLIWNITEKYFKTTKLKNRGFCFLPITTGSDGRRSHIQRALRLKTLPSHKTSKFYFLYCLRKIMNQQNQEIFSISGPEVTTKKCCLKWKFHWHRLKRFLRKRDRTQSGKPFFSKSLKVAQMWLKGYTIFKPHLSHL